MPMLNKVILIIFAIGLASSIISACTNTPPITPSISETSKTWESKWDRTVTNRQRKNEICRTIPRPHILEISEASKQIAIDELSNSRWKALNLESYKHYVGTPQKYSEDSTSQIAETLLWQAVEEEKNNETTAFRNCRNSNGPECSNYLATIAIEGQIRGTEPYLVRAALKNRGTGHFEVKECESAVIISHSSLSRTSSMSEKSPLVIFLKRNPKDIQINISVAE